MVRYATGSNASRLRAVVADHQGSPYAEVMLDADNAYSVRKQDPFGNQRAASTIGLNVVTHAGFLGATRDDASGYTPLGARLYDPGVGRFLSADPVLDLADPLQSNGYAYAHNNPVTHSDPTGLAISLNAAETAAALAGAGLSAAQVSAAHAAMGRSLTSVILSAAWNVLAEFIGLNDAMACFGGNLWGCGSLIVGAIPWAKLGKIPAVFKAVNRTVNAIQAWMNAKKAAQAVLAAAKAAEASALAAKKLAIERAKKAAQAAAKRAAEKARATAQRALQATKKTGNPVQKRAQAKAHPSGASAGKGGGGSGGSAGKGGGTKTGGSDGASSRSKGGASGGEGGGSSGPSCNTHSFAPGTLVLMADGSHRPIEKVKVGDKVIATDPKTGKATARAVTALHTNQDTDLTDVTVKITRVAPVATGGTGGTGAGRVRAAVSLAALVLSPAVAVAALVLAPAAPANASQSQGHPQDSAAIQSRVEVIETTAHHPFWSTTTGTWTNATNLNSGDQLRDLPTNTSVGTADDTTVTVTRVHNYTRTRTMHDLTVDVDHTYHVIVAAAPVLVHNCGTTDFYTVQGGEDAARLSSGGDPFPTAPERAHLGPGVYAWGSEAEAAAYAANKPGARIMRFSVENQVLASFKQRHVGEMSDEAAEEFMSMNSLLWGGSAGHDGLDYISRPTSKGTEHFFSSRVFGALRFE